MGKLKQEIFAAGKWNGFPFTQNDLRKMASAFNDLKERLKVPLKLGHNDEQPVLDGQPALGWVDSMEVVGDKLVAVFDHVPDVMMQAFDKKLYRSVSIELDFDVQYKDRFYDFVITAVALLGADMPAVNVLNDLGALMSRSSNLPQSGYAVGKQATFTSITLKEMSTMTPEEEAKLRQDLAKAQAENVTLSANFSALEATAKREKEEADARFAKIEADQKSEKVTAQRAKFTAILEEAVTAKSITPAQRESFSKALRLEDDDSILSLTEDVVKGMLPEKGVNFSRDTGHESEDEEGDADDLLSAKTHEYMAKSGEKNFSKALNVVMAGNAELAREYIHSNGTTATKGGE